MTQINEQVAWADQHRPSTELPILVAGIGSPHGDDRAGWCVVERLEPYRAKATELRKLSVPIELMDWIEHRRVLHLIDAYDASSNESPLYRFDGHDISLLATSESDAKRATEDRSEEAARILSVGFRSGGAHQMGLFEVLGLASCLRCLPEQVVLWAIPLREARVGNAMSIRCQQAIEECVMQILGNS